MKNIWFEVKNRIDLSCQTYLFVNHYISTLLPTTFALKFHFNFAPWFYFIFIIFLDLVNIYVQISDNTDK